MVDLFDIIQQIETSASKYGLDPTKFANSCLTGGESSSPYTVKVS